MNNLSKGTKCKIVRTDIVTIDGDNIILYDDNLGDIIEIIQKEFDWGDEIIYLVNNLTKKYEQYVSSKIIELV